MNAYAKRTNIAVALLAFLAVFSIASVAFADDAQADSADMNHISSSDFTEGKSGTLTIPVSLTDIRDIHVVVMEGTKTLVDKTFTDVPASKTSISVSFSLSAGTHNLNYILVSIDGEDYVGNYTVEVKEDIWSNLTTYLAIVVVAIVVIIIVVIYMRAKPNNKPTTTFTQLEEEKKAAAAAPAEPKTTSKTEKIKYTSSRRK